MLSACANPEHLELWIRILVLGRTRTRRASAFDRIGRVLRRASPPMQYFCLRAHHSRLIRDYSDSSIMHVQIRLRSP
jgi:hypothetical protein